MENTNALSKRAKRKYINLPIITKLMHLHGSTNNKKYVQSYYCAEKHIVHDSQKVTSHYCKNRCCSICNHLRSMIRINHYKEWLPKNAQFTTLTVPNCTIEELPELEKKMKRQFRIIREYISRQGIPFQFAANFECTINTEQNNYHPHIHIIHSPIKTRITGHGLKPYLPNDYDRKKRIGKYAVGTQQNIYYQNILTDYWLKAFPGATEINQKVIPIGESEKHIFQAFKYTTKPFTLAKKEENQNYQQYLQKNKEHLNTFVWMYDALFTIQKGKRYFFQNLNAPEITDEQITNKIAEKATLQVKNTPGVYDWQKHDWINKETGEALANYQPPKNLQHRNQILTNEINT